MTRANGRYTGPYGQFRKALETGKAPWSQPWERDASLPSERDLAMRAPIETVPHADLAGGLDGQFEPEEGSYLDEREIEAEADNQQEEEVEA